MARRITALKVQKRNPNRINVYLDGEFAFGLARVVAAWLSIGQELDDEKVAAMQQEDTREIAYQSALRLLGVRPRTAAEICRRLERQGFTQPVMDDVIARLTESGLVNDRQFAQTWVENRSTFRPRSHRLLALELKRMGVAEEWIDGALEDGAEDAALAYQAAIKHARRLSGLDWMNFRTRLSGFLARRGFGYDVIQPVVRQVWQETHLENDSRHDITEDEE